MSTSDGDATAATTQASPKRLPPSPCVGICTLDDVAGYCGGCGRTPDEIAEWSEAAGDRQRAIWQALPGRLAKLGVTRFRLAAEPAQIAAFVEASLAQRAGRWVMGARGAAATFTASGALQIDAGDDALTAVDGDGNALRILRHDRVRAFGLSTATGAGEMQAVALVLPRGRAELEPHGEPGRLLADEAAVVDDGRGRPSISMATGLHYSRLSLRAESVAVEEQLRRASPDDLARLAGEQDATVIVETALGRLEARHGAELSRPAGGVRSEEHTAADNDNGEGLDGVDIPRAFAACAVFYADDPVWLAAQLTP